MTAEEIYALADQLTVELGDAIEHALRAFAHGHRLAGAVEGGMPATSDTLATALVELMRVHREFSRLTQRTP